VLINSYRSAFALVSAAGMILAATPGAAAQQGTHLEQPGDPPAPAGRARTSPAPVIVPPLDPAAEASVQVNVSAEGDNILNDAANEPSIAVDPTAPNRMAIGWRQFDTIQNNFRQAGRAWTNDGGRTWRFPGVLEPGIFRSDPVLHADADGNIYYYSLRGNFFCDMFISRDGGQTFEAPVPAFGGDKQWLTIDTTTSSGRDQIYVSWSTAGNPFTPNQFSRSTDRGESFQAPVVLSQPRPRWGTMDVNNDGLLFLSGWADDSGFRVLRSSSARDPLLVPTWEANVQVNLGGFLSGFGGPNPGGLLGQVWGAVDRSGGPHEGNVYLLCSVDPPGGDPLDVMFSRSTDNGATWSPPIKVNDEAPGTNAWQWFGTMSVSPSGRIDVVWNDTVTPQTNTSELRYAFSDDAGQTWSPARAMGPAWQSMIGWPNQNKIGDYYDMKSDRVGANLAYSATYNGEQDVYYLRINDYDCNGNGVGDTGDLAAGTPDCNGNAIPDSCEIAAGAEEDADGDGIPDSCQVCEPDINGDGILDLFDFLAFQNLFVAQDPKADFDHNGVFDLFDFLAYQNSFLAGC
jgi:hypothetical protein